MTDNLVTLREYMESRIDALRELMFARIEAMELSIKVAAEAMQRQLITMNEIRGALKDQSEQFLPRNEWRTKLDTIESDIRILRESKANVEGKASHVSVMIAYGIALVGIVIAVISLLSELR